ncbi:MAG: hypothetical protein ACRDRH_04575 [Pseudonocardia sp.]
MPLDPTGTPALRLERGATRPFTPELATPGDHPGPIDHYEFARGLP